MPAKVSTHRAPEYPLILRQSPGVLWATDRELRFTYVHGRLMLGLRLHISKTIVKGPGASIAVESRPGEGSCFTVELPASRDR